jgi:hypothetical protein
MEPTSPGTNSEAIKDCRLAAFPHVPHHLRVPGFRYTAKHRSGSLETNGNGCALILLIMYREITNGGRSNEARCAGPQPD